MPHNHPLRVYYEDTDFSGVVYHAAYLRFLERGRTEFLRAHGMEQGAEHGASGLGFAVRTIQVEFLQPARMDDLLHIETGMGNIGGASFHMHQRVLRGPDILVTADVKIAVLRHGRVARVPADLKILFAKGLP